MDSTCGKGESLLKNLKQIQFKFPEFSAFFTCSEVTIIRKPPPPMKPYPSVFTLLIFFSFSRIYYLSRLVPWEPWGAESRLYADDYPPFEWNKLPARSTNVVSNNSAVRAEHQSDGELCKIPSVPLYSAAYNRSRVKRWPLMLEKCSKAVEFTMLKDGVSMTSCYFHLSNETLV